MRKTRLVILPGVRSLNKIGCLLLFLACPAIAFKGQENRDVEPFCKAQDIQEFWVQESPWPGDLGKSGGRNNDMRSQPQLGKLTQHTCYTDTSIRTINAETQRKLPTETRRLGVDRRENTRRMDSLVDSRYRRQDNLGSRRLIQNRRERVADARAETIPSSGGGRRLDERRIQNHRANTERTLKVNGSRRDFNRLDRSSPRTGERKTRLEEREARVDAETMRRGVSLNRRTRSMDNARNHERIRTELYDREVKAASRASDLRMDERRNTRREAEIGDSRRDSRIEIRLDNDNMRRSVSIDRRVRSTENLRINRQIRSEQSIRDIRVGHRTPERREDSRSARREDENMNPRLGRNPEFRRLDARRNEKVRDNQREQKTVENRRDLGEVRMERDETVQVSRLPATRIVKRYSERSAEGQIQMDRRQRVARDVDADSRRNEDRRRETSAERIMRRLDSQVDARRQTDRRNVQSLDRADRNSRIVYGENRRNRGRLQTRSAERDVLGRDTTRTYKKNTREDSIRARESRNTRLFEGMRQLGRSDRLALEGDRVRKVEGRRSGEIRRETRSVETTEISIKNINDIRRVNNDIRESRFITRNTRSVHDISRSDMRDQSIYGRGSETRRERSTSRQDIERISENSVESRRMNNNVRDTQIPVSHQNLATRTQSRNLLRVSSEPNVWDEHRSEVRNQRASSRFTQREIAGFSRDTRQSTRAAELTRYTVREQRGEAVTGSSRIRSDAGRSRSEVRVFDREDRNTLRRIEIVREVLHARRDTRNLKALKLNNEPDFRTEREVRYDGRSNTMRYINAERRSVDGSIQYERQARMVSNYGQTRREESRRVRESRVEGDIMESRTDARRISTEFRNSRIDNTGRRSTEDVRGGGRRTLITSNNRESSRVLTKRNDETRVKDVNQLAIARSISRRFDDERRSDRAVQRSGDGGRASEGKVESRLSEGSRRRGRSLEREASDMMSIERRSSRLSRSIGDMRRSERRGEIDSARQETRRFGDSRNIEIQRGTRNLGINKNSMESRLTDKRKMETESRHEIRSDDMRRFERRGQVDSTRQETRRFDDRRSSEIQREMRNLGINKNSMERRQKDMMRMETGSRHEIRSEDMRRSERRGQVDFTRQETRRFDDRRSGEIQRGIRDLGININSMERRRTNMRRMETGSRNEIDDMRGSERRGEIDYTRQATRRFDDRRSSEIQRGIRNLGMKMNSMERRRRDTRGMETDIRHEVRIEDMRRSDKAAQLSRTERDERRMGNTRSVNDRREREIRNAENKIRYSDNRDSRFSSSRLVVMKAVSDESNQQKQMRNVHERTRRTDNRRDGRSQMDARRLARDDESTNANIAVAKGVKNLIRSDDTLRRTERLNRAIPKGTETRRALKITDSRAQDLRKTRISNPEAKLERIVKPERAEGRFTSAERITNKWRASADNHNTDQMYGMSQKTSFFAAAQSAVTDWLATFDVKMTDISRLGETVMYGGIVCYALFANVNKKAIF